MLIRPQSEGHPLCFNVLAEHKGACRSVTAFEIFGEFTTFGPKLIYMWLWI